MKSPDGGRSSGQDSVLVCSFSREGDEVVVVGGIHGAGSVVMILLSNVLDLVDHLMC